MADSFANAVDPEAEALAAQALEAEKRGTRLSIKADVEEGKVAVATDEELTAAAIHPNAGISADPISKLAAITGIDDKAALQTILEAATAALSGSHKAEVDALRREIDQVRNEGREGKVADLNESMGGYPWMYYRFPSTFPDKQRRGWITMGPGGASPKDGRRDTGSFATYLKKGMIPITKYGLCPVPTSPVVANNYVEFIKRGGAVEFPASQIVAYSWHRNNPFVRLGVRWTQVDPIRHLLQSWTCEYCGFEMDFMPDDPTAGTTYRSHLVNVDKLTFKDAVQSVKDAGLTTTPYKQRTIEQISAMARPDAEEPEV